MPGNVLNIQVDVHLSESHQALVGAWSSARKLVLDKHPWLEAVKIGQLDPADQTIDGSISATIMASESEIDALLEDTGQANRNFFPEDELIFFFEGDKPSAPYAFVYRAGSAYSGGYCRDETIPANLVATFLDQLASKGAEAALNAWVKPAEVLIRQVTALLDEPNPLEQRLADALQDLESARAYIRSLEQTNHLLMEQVSGVARRHVNKTLVASFALAIATFLGPSLQSTVNHYLDKPTKEAIATTHRVRVACGPTTVTVDQEDTAQ